MLRERSSRILKLLVEQFLQTGEPVGSRTLSKAGIEASPATIRNEMADLEDAGFVTQPHTSAGRVPTDKGYRFWLDTLSAREIDLLEKDQAELTALEQRFLRECRGLEDLVHNSVRILSKVSELAGMASMPSLTEMSKARIQLVGLDRGHVMAVVISESGLASSHILSVTNTLTQEELNNVSQLFNDSFSRQSIQELLQGRLQHLRHLEKRAQSLAGDILDRLEGVLVKAETELFYDGLSRVFLQAGTSDPETVERLVRSFTRRDYAVPETGEGRDTGVLVKVGSETKLEGLEDFALITAGYGAGSGRGGTIGILGPKRMDYRRVIGVVDHMRRRLEEILT